VSSLKGKEKEVIGADMRPSYLNSSALTTILEEFKAMKEEMRRSQQRSQSEVESMKLSHFMELEALKDEI
jgi:response regulator of citrate/malate metabolism